MKLRNRLDHSLPQRAVGGHRALGIHFYDALTSLPLFVFNTSL